MRQRKRILLIAATTGYQTRAFAAAGERLGYEVQLATDRCHVLDDPWGDRAIPLRFNKPEFAAKKIAKFALETTPFDGIVAVGDRPTVLGAHAARELGLPYNSPEAVVACGNKYSAREHFRAAGLPVPQFRRIPLDTEASVAAADVEYPCV